MNYLILKSIVDTTIAHFECNECGTHITERDVMVSGSTEREVVLEARCPKCHTVSGIKAEINLIKSGEDIVDALRVSGEIARIELPTGLLSEMSTIIDTAHSLATSAGEVDHLSKDTSTIAIRDEDIVGLHASISNKQVSAADLFN
jgi:predicted RNA-binding Zn-ribbon protein involved in translation (DUF1610 family)